MASTQPHQNSPSAQQIVVSTTTGKNRVMPTTSSTAASNSGASASGSSSNPGAAVAASGIVPAAAAAAAAAALTMSVTPNSGSANQSNQDLASLFECPVCFDYVLPPILQVRCLFDFQFRTFENIIKGLENEIPGSKYLELFRIKRGIRKEDIC